MNFKEFKDLLLSVSPDVYHFESTKESEYIVWHEVGTRCLMGDGKQIEIGTRIAVDYFTKLEYSQIPEKLEKALANHDEICLSDSVVDFEHDTGMIHYAYTCEVM